MVQAIKRDEVYIEPEGIYVETHQPERRSRKPPLLLVHGALTGSWLWSPSRPTSRSAGWEAHAMNLRGHYTSDLADLVETTMADYADDIGVAVRQLGRPPVVIAWGIGALAALLYAQRRPVLGLVLLAPSPPAAALPRRADEHELHAVPDVYDARWWGWIAPMDRLRSWMPDMTTRADQDAGDAPRRTRVGERPSRADDGRGVDPDRDQRARAWSSARAWTT